MPSRVGRVTYLCRELVDGMSTTRIGYLLIRDHTTVMHAIRKIRQKIWEDPVTDGQIRDLTVLIKRQAALEVLRRPLNQS